MIKKVAIASLIVIATSLAACGQSANDSAETAKVAAPEVSQPIADTAVQPMSAEALAKAKPSTAACSFDSVDGNFSATQARLDKSSSHVFRGWALAEDKHVPHDIMFVLKGADNFVITVKSGVDRPDVGSHFKDATLSGAGFNFTTDLKPVPSGSYHVYLLTRLGDVSYSCETKKSIAVF